MLRIFYSRRPLHFILIPWCWLCAKLDRCDWCFAPIVHSEFDYCSHCRWGPEYPSRWEA